MTSINTKIYPKINLDEFKLYPLQEEIRKYIYGESTNIDNEPYQFLTLCMGRQVGKSFLLKKIALDYAVNMRKRVMWVTPSIPTVLGHWNDLVAVITNIGFPIRKMDSQHKEIHFKGGGSISIRSAIKPDNLRGPSVDLMLLDECAFFPNGQYLWQSILMPMVSTTKGKVVFASTPNGKNWFYKLWKQGNDPKNTFYKSFHAPSSVSPYQNAKFLEETRRETPEATWKQEWLALFISDAGGVFSGIDKSATVTMQANPVPGETYYAGIDIGSVNDESTFTVIEERSRRQVYGEAWTGIGAIPQIKRIGKLLNHWKPKLTNFERNGVGLTFFDLMKHFLSGKEADPDLLAAIERYDAEERESEDEYKSLIGDEDEEDVYEDVQHLPTMPVLVARRIQPNGRIAELDASIGGHKVRALHVTNERKKEWVDNLSLAIEFGRLSILDDKTDYGSKQISQMSTYERQSTAKGMGYTYNASPGQHDDCVSSLYLAFKGLPRIAKPKSESEGSIHVMKNPFRSTSRIDPNNKNRKRR